MSSVCIRNGIFLFGERFSFNGLTHKRRHQPIHLIHRKKKKNERHWLVTSIVIVVNFNVNRATSATNSYSTSILLRYALWHIPHHETVAHEHKPHTPNWSLLIITCCFGSCHCWFYACAYACYVCVCENGVCFQYFIHWLGFHFNSLFLPFEMIFLLLCFVSSGVPVRRILCQLFNPYIQCEMLHVHYFFISLILLNGYWLWFVYSFVFTLVVRCLPCWRIYTSFLW